jgi:hypothetical protein
MGLSNLLGRAPIAYVSRPPFFAPHFILTHGPCAPAVVSGGTCNVSLDTNMPQACVRSPPTSPFVRSPHMTHIPSISLSGSLHSHFTCSRYLMCDVHEWNLSVCSSKPLSRAPQNTTTHRRSCHLACSHTFLLALPLRHLVPFLQDIIRTCQNP